MSARKPLANNSAQHGGGFRVSVTMGMATNGFERTMNEIFMAALRTHSILPRVHWLEGGHPFPLVEVAIITVRADAAEFFGAGVTQP